MCPKVPDINSSYGVYNTLIGNFYYNYAMLVINSFGLQNALERSPVDKGHFFTRTHQSAVACATLVRDELGPKGYLRYSPDSHFVQCSYAVLSLLKVGTSSDMFQMHYNIYASTAYTAGVSGFPRG